MKLPVAAIGQFQAASLRTNRPDGTYGAYVSQFLPTTP